MLGRFQFDDEPLAGDDGTYDSRLVVIACGVLFPLAVICFGGFVVWNSGLTLRRVRYEGPHAVAGLVSACLGVALLLVSRYLLPNVFRQSYQYQYYAIAGVVLAVIGFAWFVGAALR